MFGLSKLYAGVGAALIAVLLLTGCYAKGRHDGKVAEQKHSAVALAKLQASWDREKAAQMAAASAHNAQAAQVTADIDGKAQAAQTVIQTRYRTLVQKVPQYVPPSADPVVPAGLVGLLDAAAAGDDPDSVSFSRGGTYETGQGVKLSTLSTVVVENYGTAHQNARQLGDLQSWVRAQEALNR
jgi:outer membrane murein-binding lipoprotein Lpp